MSLIAATALILASGASAEAGNDQPNNDPMVCESSTEIGSRLKRRKVCMRKSEWERQRQEEKQMIDRSQVQRGTITKD